MANSAKMFHSQAKDPNEMLSGILFLQSRSNVITLNYGRNLRQFIKLNAVS